MFTKQELTDVRDVIMANKVAAPAKAGALAPIDVVVPAQNTGLGPEKTSFFQALSIQTKISKGTIEMLVRTTYCCGCLDVFQWSILGFFVHAHINCFRLTTN